MRPSSSLDSDSILARSRATLPLPMTTALSQERSKDRSAKSGCPLYQPTNSTAESAPGKVLPRDRQPAIALGTDGVDDGVVAAQQVLSRHVGPDADVPEEPEPGIGRGALVGRRDRLQLRVVGSHARTHQPPGGREAVEDIDCDRADGRARRCPAA